MPFAFTQEQQDLRSVLAGYFSDRAPIAATHHQIDQDSGSDLGVWRGLCDDMGVQLVDIGESEGGIGLSAVELAIVMESAGTELYSGPLLASTGFALGLVLGIENGAARDIRRSVAAGDVVAAAIAEVGAEWDPDPTTMATTAELRDGRWLVTGSKQPVLQANEAEMIVVSAVLPDGRVGLLAVDPASAIVQRLPSIDPTRMTCAVEMDDTPGVMLLADAAHQIHSAWQRAGVALAAESLGAARRCLELASEYACERRQFGHAIGAFQGVKHPLANALVDIELASSAVYLAACHVAAGDTSAVEASVPMALTTATQVLVDVAACSVQVHGGMGFTWESVCHLFVKRGQASRHLLGERGRQLMAVYDHATSLTS